MDTSKQYTVVAKSRGQGKAYNYTIKANTGERTIITKDMLVKYINAGLVTNARAQIYNGSYIIRIKDEKKQETKAPAKTDKSLLAKEIYGRDAINYLNVAEAGTPILCKSKTGDFEQVIYTGAREVQGQRAFTFFDGESGINGSFALSFRYILNNIDIISFKINCNNPLETERLLNMIKSMSR